MKNRKKLSATSMMLWAFALLQVLNSFQSNAQEVLIRLMPLPINQFTLNDVWKTEITNTTSKVLKVKLRAVVREDKKGLLLNGTSAAFDLPAGFSGPLESQWLDPVVISYVDKNIESFCIKTGSMPPGTYVACVYVMDATSMVELSKDCIQFDAQTYSPPQLLTPHSKAEIRPDEMPLFSWTPVIPEVSGIVYGLKIVELHANQSPEAGMASNAAFHQNKQIKSLQYLYPMNGKSILIGKMYAWQVTAFTSAGELIAESEVSAFYCSDLLDAETEVINIPVLKHPAHNTLVELTDDPEADEIILQKIKFEWTPPQKLPPEFNSYSLKIVMIKKGQSPADALANNQPFFIKDGILHPEFSLNPDDPDYWLPFPYWPMPPSAKIQNGDDGSRYAWQVTMMNSAGKQVGSASNIHIIEFRFPRVPIGPDYGDAPDEDNAPVYHYASHNGRNPAVHKNGLYERLGIQVSAESNAKTINLDEYDDGVDLSTFIFPFTGCQAQTIKVTVRASGPTERYSETSTLHLHAWFDLNQNGFWTESVECPATTTPAGEHIYWLSWTSGSAGGPINNHDFEIKPHTWGTDARGRRIITKTYDLTFLTWRSPLNNIPQDSLWCRFRLSYGTSTTDLSIATDFKGTVDFGETEDYVILLDESSDPDCNCIIEGVLVDGIPAGASGSTVYLDMGETRSLSLVGSCVGCSGENIEWTILKPGGISEPVIRGRSIDYTFSVSGEYLITATMHCPDGSECSFILKVTAAPESTSGTLMRFRPDPIISGAYCINHTTSFPLEIKFTPRTSIDEATFQLVVQPDGVFPGAGPTYTYNRSSMTISLSGREYTVRLSLMASHLLGLGSDYCGRYRLTFSAHDMAGHTLSESAVFGFDLDDFQPVISLNPNLSPTPASFVLGPVWSPVSTDCYCVPGSSLPSQIPVDILWASAITSGNVDINLTITDPVAHTEVVVPASTYTFNLVRRTEAGITVPGYTARININSIVASLGNSKILTISVTVKGENPCKCTGYSMQQTIHIKACP